MTVALQALEINEIDEDTLTFGTVRSDAARRTLPTRRVQLPVDDISCTAILSWRWDIDERSGVSRNVRNAIRQAKQMGIRHLFVDLISVDQSLRGDELLRDVVAFSAQYERLPVIAAYDDITLKSRNDWRWTMRRPWLLREARALRTNPTRVVYVGHVDGQGALEDDAYHSAPVDRFQFVDMLKRIWSSSFTHSILGVLCGEIGMYSISDLRFIMPEHTRILTAAHDRMSRNDYLLTAAILANAPVSNTKVNASSDISRVTFDRYTRSPAPGGTYDSNEDIFLDGERVATWTSHYNLATSNTHCRLNVMPSAGRVVFAALGLAEAEYEEVRHAGGAETQEHCAAGRRHHALSQAGGRLRRHGVRSRQTSRHISMGDGPCAFSWARQVRYLEAVPWLAGVRLWFFSFRPSPL